MSERHKRPKVPTHITTMRIPVVVLRILEHAAERNFRSLNAEVVMRLESSLKDEVAMDGGEKWKGLFPPSAVSALAASRTNDAAAGGQR